MFILRSERRKKETLINVLNERAAVVGTLMTMRGIFEEKKEFSLDFIIMGIRKYCKVLVI